MPPEISEALQEERLQLQRMRYVSLLEGATLIVLVFGAVPLKHLLGYAVATAIMGPIHGLAFLFYIWMLIQTVSGGNWAARETVHLLIGAFIPFGAFANERLLRRKERALGAAPSPVVR
jgi:integral membrane protein